MLRRLRDLQAWTVETHDDRVIGRVDDFYLDDQRWTVRYIAVNVGNWFPQRQVLISTLGIESIDWDGTRIVTDLTREEAKRTSIGGGSGASPTAFLHRCAAEAGIADPDEENRSSLHSVHSVSGCHIHALDGEVGRIKDVFAEDDLWTIRYFAVDASQWVGGIMLVAPEWIRCADWKAGIVHVDLAREDLRSSRQDHPRMETDRASEERRHAPAYWVAP